MFDGGETLKPFPDHGRKLPKGWQRARLDNVADRASGHTPDQGKAEYWNGGVEWVSLADSAKLDQGYIEETDKQISHLGIRHSSAVLLPPETVILSRDAGVGKSAVLKRQMAVSQHFIAWSCAKKNQLDPWFLYAWMQTQKPFFERMAVGSTIKTIGLPIFKRLTIDFPPLPEQRKIAEILRTWDEALEKLTALRVAKARRLRGLGRALLARAADDPVTVSRPLSDLARIVKGQQLNKLDIAEGEYPVWNGGVTPSGFHDQWNTEGGTITISSGGNSCGFINFAAGKFWLGGDCFALTDMSPRVDHDFIFHSLKAREAEIMRLRFGSGIPHIYRADLERLPVLVPPLDMQERIARVLTAGNDEIALLDAEIAALTRQKRGLMQKLLTGAWRVCP